MKKSLLRLFALAMICLASSSLWAQVTTSALTGTVIDQASKERLIGASVVAKHLPSGTTYGAVTNAKGNYSIVGMRPGGPYSITVSYIGYDALTLNNISLALGETETINVKLKDGATQITEVVVTGKKGSAFNLQKTGAGTSFSRRNIERVPTVSRSIMDIAKLTPQSNGNGSFAGANSRFNSFQIDGAVNNDVFGLGQSGKNAISIEAIDALQVVIAPFDVRQSGFTGGGMNAITKSGTNSLHGSVYDFYHNQDFYGSTAGKDVAKRTKLSKQYENTVGFTLGGPIIKDKLFFFANAEYVKKVTPATFIPGDGLSRITVEEAEQVAKKLQELGYDAGGYKAQDIPEETYKGLLRLDWNINQAHHLTLRYSHIDDKPYVFSNSATQLKFSNYGYTKRSVTNTFVAELNSRLSSTVSNELRASYSGIRDKRSFPGKPFPSVTINLSGGRRIFAGTDPFSGANELDQDIFSLTDNLTLNAGNHTFTFGTHNEFFRMRNLFINNLYGTYEYRNREVPNPAGGKPIVQPGLVDFMTIGTAGEVGPSTYNLSRVNTAVTGTPLWSPQFHAGQVSLYAQDDWKVNDQLRLTYGLRVDAPFFLDRPTENKKFNSGDIAREYEVTNHYLPGIKPLFSPRFGFRYSVDEDRRYTIRGGTGVFTGRVPFVWISNSFSNSGIEVERTSLYAGNNKSLGTVRFSADPRSAQSNANFVPGSTEVDLVAKNFTYPQVWRTNLAFEANLPWGVKASIEGMFTKNLNNIRYRNLALSPGKAITHAPGQVRPTYTRRDDKLYSSVIMIENSNKGYTYNFTATLSKDFGHGLDASVAYTYGAAVVGNDGLSSQAESNWKFNYSNDINADEVSYSSFDLRHRLIAQLNYRVEYAKHFATTIGLIYNGQSGPRYSILYNGDINGDGTSNDLAYLPATMQSSSRSAMDYATFLKENPDIAQYVGRIAPRNAFVAPFIHKVDLHFAQDFFVNVGGRRHTLQLNADVINLTNLLNRGWGMEPYVNYSSITPITVLRDGSYEFNHATKQPWSYSDINSRWRAQVGLKYIF